MVKQPKNAAGLGGAVLGIKKALTCNAHSNVERIKPPVRHLDVGLDDLPTSLRSDYHAGDKPHKRFGDLATLDEAL